MISQEAIEKILGISQRTDLSKEDMAKSITFTFFPYNPALCSREVLDYISMLQEALKELGINVIPYGESLIRVPFIKVFKRFFKIAANNILYLAFEATNREHGYYYVHPGAFLNLLKRDRVRKGVTIIAVGENKKSKLPIDYTSSFSQNSIITILDRPSNIDENTSFATHFDTAMNIFSYHMTQIVILVSQDKWVLYNFNASHPIYKLNDKESFKKNILSALVPKVAAPMRPPLFKDFSIASESFDIDSEFYKESVTDFIEGGKLFNQTNLYPTGKKVDSLPFRSGFYRWIGAIHLDHRSGMSYGFLARQLPVDPAPLVPYKKLEVGSDITSKDYFIENGHLNIILEISSGIYSLRIPPIWVLTLRSGSDKTNVNPHKDVLLLGLEDGKMHLRTPIGMKLRKDYRPSFDTKVILAHAVGNAIIASILEHMKKTGSNVDISFANNLKMHGAAIAHWHGYIRSDLIPEGWPVYGNSNPHVACSTAQSAVYALDGKLNSFNRVMMKGKENYKGDIHIEPHHGSNITFTSIHELAKFFLKNPNASVLGNKYLVES